MIELELPTFVTPDGQRVEEHTMRVVSTPKRRVNITMEITTENFEWLAKAAQLEWDCGARPAETRALPVDEDVDLPELAPPCKYRKGMNGKLKIVCYYRQHGVWKMHQKVVNRGFLDDKTNFEANVRKCEAEVMGFYSAHHDHTSPEGSPEEPDAELTT